MSAPGAPSEPGAHLLVVDDDSRIRGLLLRFLRREGYLATAARDAAQARRLLGGLTFDIVVLDVMMPGEDGLSLARSITRDGGPPILMLTARGGVEDRIAGLQSGVDDYLPKPFEPRELLLRITAILRRAARAPAPPDPPRTLTLGDAFYDIGKGELTRSGEDVRLTATEQALMQALSQSPNAAISRAALVEHVGGAEGAGSERAVDVQITRLRRKLEADPRNPRFLRTVRGEGYMLTPD